MNQQFGFESEIDRLKATILREVEQRIEAANGAAQARIAELEGKFALQAQVALGSSESTRNLEAAELRALEAQERVRALESQVAASNAEKATLREELIDGLEVIEDLQQRTGLAEIEVTRLKNELASRAAAPPGGASSEQVAQLESQLAAASAECARLREESASLEIQLAQKVDAALSAETEKQAAEAQQRAALEAQLAAARAEVAAALEESGRSQTLAEGLLHQLSTLEAELVSRPEPAEAEQRVAQAQQRATGLESQLGASVAEIARLQGEVAQSSQQLSALQAELAGKAVPAEADQQVAQAQERVSALESQLAAATAESTRLQAESAQAVAGLQQQLSALQAELAGRTAPADAEQQVAQAQERVAALESQLAAAASESARLQAESAQTMAALQQQLSALQAELTGKADPAEAEQRVAQANERAAALESQLAAATSESARQLEESRLALEALQQQLAALQAKAEPDGANRVVELEGQLTTVAAEKVRLQEESARNLEVVARLEERCLAAQTEVARLERELAGRPAAALALAGPLLAAPLLAPLALAASDGVAARPGATEGEALIKQLRDEIAAGVRERAELAAEIADLRLDNQLAAAREAERATREAAPGGEADARAIQRLAFEDPISGLPNSHLGRRYLTQELEKAKLDQVSVALAMIDIDDLGAINSHFGQNAGDTLLRLMADRIKGALQPEDVLVRGRDDEFWVILTWARAGPLGLRTVGENAMLGMNRMLEALKSPFAVGENVLNVTVACGISSGQGREDASVLIDRAALAVKGSKTNPRTKVSLFQPEMEKPSQQRSRLAPELRQAIDKKQLTLHYQPIYDLKTMQAWGLESLIRWAHPTRGVVDPGQFMETAREHGLIVTIGKWVAREVCQRSKTIDLKFSLNVSALELMQADYVKQFTKQVEAAKLPRPDALIVEVSETQMLNDNSALNASLKELRRCNIQLAIDDFSFDALSLRRIQDLNVNYIKVSNALVHRVESAREGNLVRTALVAASGLGCQVIAKGIETARELQILQELGCQLGQGYFLAAPLPWENVQEKITASRQQPRPTRG